MMTNINVKNTIEVQGDVIPDTDNTRNLGTSSVNWAETHTEDLYVYGNLVTDLVPNVSGVRDLGSSSNRWKDAYVTDLYTSGTSTFSGDISVSGSIGSDLIPNITGIQDLGSSTKKWKDAYVTDLYASGSSTLSGSVSIPGTIGSSLVPSGTQNIGSDAVRWNSLYGAYARITNNVHTGAGTTGSPAYSFEGDGDTGMFLYNSGGLKAPAIVTDGAIQEILSSTAKSVAVLGPPIAPLTKTTYTFIGTDFAPNTASLGVLLASYEFVAQSNTAMVFGLYYTQNDSSVSDTIQYIGLRLMYGGFPTGQAAVNSWNSLKVDDRANFVSTFFSIAVTPGLTYTIELRGDAIDAPVPVNPNNGTLSNTIRAQGTIGIMM